VKGGLSKEFLIISNSVGEVENENELGVSDTIDEESVSQSDSWGRKEKDERASVDVDEQTVPSSSFDVSLS
jgi:hypothetical protein